MWCSKPLCWGCHSAITVSQGTNCIGVSCCSQWVSVMTRSPNCPYQLLAEPLQPLGMSISKLLHCAEYTTMPQEAQHELQRLTTALVDRGLSPSGLQERSQHALPGVPSQLLPGRPVQGGFGAMPWQQHITLSAPCQMGSKIPEVGWGTTALGCPTVGTPGLCHTSVPMPNVSTCCCTASCYSGSA